MLMPEYAFMSCVGVSVRKENGDKCIKMLCYAVRLLLFTLVLSVHGTWTHPLDILVVFAQMLLLR